MKYTFFTNLVFVARSLLFLTKTTAGTRPLSPSTAFPPPTRNIKLSFGCLYRWYSPPFPYVSICSGGATLRLWISTLLSENHFFVGISPLFFCFHIYWVSIHEYICLDMWSCYTLVVVVKKKKSGIYLLLMGCWCDAATVSSVQEVTFLFICWQ